MSAVELGASPATRSEALAYRPVKNREVRKQQTPNGDVLLTYPLILRPWLANLARVLGLRSNEFLSRKLQLDEMGSLVWTLMDGKRTVQDMLNVLSQRYKLNRREIEVALTSFLRELGRRGLIGFRPPYGDEDENST